MEKVAERGRWRAPCSPMLYDCDTRGASSDLRSAGRNLPGPRRHVRLASRRTIGQGSRQRSAVRSGYDAPATFELGTVGHEEISAHCLCALLSRRRALRDSG